MQSSPLSLRRFPDPISQTAQSWFDDPIQSIPVTVLGEYSQTADGACRVQFGGSMVGFVKPRPDSQNPLVVANEKIAADLGYLLNLPVAPVVIRSPEQGNEWSRFSAMSLACLSAGRHWAETPPPHSGFTVPGLEALRVYWSWIGDIDHNAHPNNLLYEFDVVGCQLLAIDHSYAFGHGGNSDVLTVAVSAGYGAHQHDAARAARIATLDAIEALNWETVNNIVARLVGPVIDDNYATQVLRWLSERRAVLRQLMNVGG